MKHSVRSDSGREKYLGVVLDLVLAFKDHLVAVAGKAEALSRPMLRVGGAGYAAPILSGFIGVR